MLLPIKQLHSYIHFPSPFSHNGFGYRCLTHMERLSLFGLPSVIPVGSQTFAIPPVQWSSAILHPSLTLQPIHPIDAVSLPLPPIHDDRGFSVMPHINVKLSHDWCLPAMSSTGAAKKDSAVVIQDLWNQRILLPFPHVTPQSLNQFRRLLMTKLYVKLCKEFKKYICEKYFNGSIEGTIYNRGGNSGNSWGDECEFGDKQQMKTLSTDIQAGRSVLSAYLNSSYMTWNKGSALIFWRWPTTLQTIARDGFPPKLLHNLPTNLKRPHAMKEDDRLKLLEKLSTCLSKGYLRLVPASNVKSYIDIFGVPKGPDDIRMVLNGASCGINESLFSSNFWLPMSNTMTRLLSFGYRAVDVDLGEMFLNFPLDHVLQGYSGIDLSMFRK